MELLDRDILADVCGLSLPLVVTGLVLGLTLWLFGWRTHRFWVVLIMTVLAGIYGLYEAPPFRAQPLLASLLLAVAAGLLALAMIRVLAFVAGGGAGLLLVQAAAPTWSQPLLAFLACGLLGLLLFRLWMMALTSFSGALVIAYALLSLLNRADVLQAVEWSSGKGTVLFNWMCGLLAAAGLAFQFYLDRRRQGKKEKKPGKPSGGPELLVPLWGWAKPQKKAG
jgi:hypothetical protein